MSEYSTYTTYQELLPEYCYRKQELQADGAVLHYYSGRFVDPDNRFDPTVCRNLAIDLNSDLPNRTHYLRNDRQNRYFASYHYVIDREGDRYLWVPKYYQAYHAGKSEINGRTDLNRSTYGISFLADPNSGFTDRQYESCARLLNTLKVPINSVWGHDQVSPGRKVDPGPNFSWEKLNRLRRSFKAGTI